MAIDGVMPRSESVLEELGLTPRIVRWEEEDVDIEAAADAFGAQRPTPEEMVEFRKRFESQHRFEMPASGTYLPHTSQPKSL